MMEIIKVIKFLLWLIENNDHGEYEKLIDSLFDDLNYNINRELYLRGYRKG